MVEPINTALPERLVLAGFMGSGKSTVGRLLAQRLGWDFLDLDHVIEERTGLSVPALFARAGESAFRQHEIVALAGLLQQRRLVLALGGGAPETSELRRLLLEAPQTVVVWLHAPFEVLYARCLLQAEDPASTARPLLTERPAAEQRYARRLPLYTEVAHHTLDVAAGTPDEIAVAILGRLAPQSRSV